MAASQNISGRILAHDLAAYTDGELDQYLQEHTSEGGPTVVNVADPENLSSDFIQRLRDRAQHASIATHAHAVDLDQVTARLLQATSSRFASPQPQSPASDGNESCATLPVSPGVNNERRCHAMLVDDGGRPLYPISLLDDVSQDPGAYKEMLRPWLDAPDQDPLDWDGVFEKQAYSWRDFRLWQAYNRNESSADITVQPCVMVYKFFSRHFRHKSTSYTEALGSLLAQYGFTRPFQLQDHAADQDGLTTWIEYLGFVCAEHYRSAQFVQRGQPEQDEAWKALVDSGVLRPCETREYFDDISSAYLLDAEEARAHQGVEMAELAVAAALEKESKPPDGSRQEHALELDTSRSRLDVALKQLESVQRRNDLIGKFKSGGRNHGLAREAARRHYAKVQWILDQMPLVEAEMTEAQAAGGDSNSPSGNPNSGGEPRVQSRRKRPREQSEDQPTKPLTTASVSPPAQTGSDYKRTRLDNTEDGPLQGRSKRLRKNLDGAIADMTTPRGRPTTSRTTRSSQPDATPQKPLSPTRESKQRTRRFAASDSGVAPRRSRRLTRDQPEFGLLKEQRDATPVEERVQRPSGARQQVQAPLANVPKSGGTTAPKQAPTARKKRRAR